MPISVTLFQFDPNAHLFGDLTVRWGALALAAVIVASLILAGLLARAGGLPADDVAFVAVGVVPGAVVGARIGYLLLHESYFATAPGRLVDPSIGGMELGLAVAGGFLTGSYVASLLGASVGRWLQLAALPVLLALGAGKLTMVLTGTGQGAPSDGATATAYLGPGPWGSLVPTVPSVPSQAYEGIATLAILTVLAFALMLGGFRGRDGRLFFVAIGMWAIARALVSTTWREPLVAAGLNAGGLIAVSIALACALALVITTVRRRGRAADDPSAQRGPRPDATVWPDPETRPRF
ncbi:MAG: prolipoprotein diacylglyceryl transferase family protein [Chloroflexota bacterium]